MDESRDAKASGTPTVALGHHAGLRLLRGGKTREFYNEMLIARVKGMPAMIGEQESGSGQ